MTETFDSTRDVTLGETRSWEAADCEEIARLAGVSLLRREPLAHDDEGYFLVIERTRGIVRWRFSDQQERDAWGKFDERARYVTTPLER